VSRFLSRKFIQSAAAEAALAGALVACLWRAELHPYLPYVVGALAAVAVGYGAANAWQRRGEDAVPPPDM